MLYTEKQRGIVAERFPGVEVGAVGKPEVAWEAKRVLEAQVGTCTICQMISLKQHPRKGSSRPF